MRIKRSGSSKAPFKESAGIRFGVLGEGSDEERFSQVKGGLFILGPVGNLDQSWESSSKKTPLEGGLLGLDRGLL